MTAELPARPSFDLLRKQAKELLRAARAGDANALARCRAAVPRLAALEPAALAAAVCLADVQHALAREHGFPSWPKLKRQVENQQPIGELAERFLAAVREEETGPALRLLQRHPDLVRASFFAACAAGDVEAVAAALAAEPARAVALHSPDGWNGLHYVAASPLRLPAQQENLGRCAERLLDQGADPNSYTLWQHDDPASKLSALYRACNANHVAVVRLLLERGADPNDGESIYHAAERNHRECLELLRVHGCDLSGRHSHWGNTPLYFLAGYKESSPDCAPATEGMRWLLEHGADPNVTSYKTEETPLHRFAAFGRGAAATEMLLAHGAEVDRPRADGRTAYALAVRAGNTATAESLLRHGAVPDLGPIDEFLGACMAADCEGARALLARQPDLLSQLDAEDRQVLALAAEERREASVRLMVELGFDLLWEGQQNGTALHVAAWFGDPAMVRLLLALRAPVNPRDSQFGSSPLGWACHGSTNCRRGSVEDYGAVVEALLDAGADRESSINRWGEAPESMASRQVAAILRRRGFVP